MDSSHSRYHQLRDTDFQHLWHPFTASSIWQEEDPLIVERACGVELIDVEGNKFLDGVSSLWCNVHGHGVPEIIRAIQEQTERLCHVTLLGVSHVPIIELTDKLLQTVPKELSRAFFADSGAAAVEAGLRMAVEWWQHQPGAAAKQKNRFLSLRNAYHGDTLGAVGVGFLEGFHDPLRSVVVPGIQVSSPHEFRFCKRVSSEEALSLALQELETVLVKHAFEIAAFIVEPLVQGAAGMCTYEAAYLREAKKLCEKHDVFLIVDEVATGFGKTGTLYAFEQAEICPDIVILGKGLSAGYLPISAALTTRRIFEGFLGGPGEGRTFSYGQTFAGNPVAAASSIANLELFQDGSVMEKTRERIVYFTQELSMKIAPLAHVDEIRSLGLMVGIELTKLPGERASYAPEDGAGVRITREARKRGAFIRPIENVLTLMPALAMKEEQLTQLVEITAESIIAALGE